MCEINIMLKKKHKAARFFFLSRKLQKRQRKIQIYPSKGCIKNFISEHEKSNIIPFDIFTTTLSEKNPVSDNKSM